MNKLPIIYVEQLKPSFLPYGSMPVPNGIWDCLQANKAYEEHGHDWSPEEPETAHLDLKA
jgi:hypothetical protein